MAAIGEEKSGCSIRKILGGPKFLATEGFRYEQCLSNSCLGHVDELSSDGLNIVRRHNRTQHQTPRMLRTQYHFRKSSQGLLAWDVRRLVKLSSALQVRQVAIAEIAELNEEHWYCHGAATPTCRSIVEHCSLILKADLSYPIILDQNGRVMDGMHRVCKALMQNQPFISAVQFPVDPKPDYVNYDPESLPYE